MVTGWWFHATQKSCKQARHRQRYCRACGKTATIGNYCDTCRAFLDDQKKNEGGRVHGKA